MESASDFSGWSSSSLSSVKNKNNNNFKKTTWAISPASVCFGRIYPECPAPQSPSCFWRISGPQIAITKIHLASKQTDFSIPCFGARMRRFFGRIDFIIDTAKKVRWNAFFTSHKSSWIIGCYCWRKRQIRRQEVVGGWWRNSMLANDLSCQQAYSGVTWIMFLI